MVWVVGCNYVERESGANRCVVGDSPCVDRVPPGRVDRRVRRRLVGPGGGVDPCIIFEKNDFNPKQTPPIKTRERACTPHLLHPTASVTPSTHLGADDVCRVGGWSSSSQPAAVLEKHSLTPSILLSCATGGETHPTVTGCGEGTRGRRGAGSASRASGAEASRRGAASASRTATAAASATPTSRPGHASGTGSGSRTGRDGGGSARGGRRSGRRRRRRRGARGTRAPGDQVLHTRSTGGRRRRRPGGRRRSGRGRHPGRRGARGGRACETPPRATRARRPGGGRRPPRRGGRQTR